MESLSRYLRELVESEDDLARATVAFRAFHRLLTHRQGRPNYPEPVTWNTHRRSPEMVPFNPGWGRLRPRRCRWPA
jgi:hypothetical protein